MRDNGSTADSRLFSPVYHSLPASDKPLQRQNLCNSNAIPRDCFDGEFSLFWNMALQVREKKKPDH